MFVIATGLLIGVSSPTPVEARPLDRQASAHNHRAKTAKEKRPRKGKRKRLEGGWHWRVKTSRGPIHVWIPRGYDRDSAGMVVYVHGYHTDVDGAWKRHKLARQFRRSRQNAMFVAPEAPAHRGQRVHWDAIGDLKKTLWRAGFRLPDGPPIAVGHSAAFRTIRHWVDNRLLAQVILLDTFYGGGKQFSEFIDSGKRAKHHKMVVIGADRAREARRFAKQFRYAVIRDNMPTRYSQFTRREKRAKLLYIRSQYGHTSIVTSGKVIPLLLRLTPLKRL